MSVRLSSWGVFMNCGTITAGSVWTAKRWTWSLKRAETGRFEEEAACKQQILRSEPEAQIHVPPTAPWRVSFQNQPGREKSVRTKLAGSKNKKSARKKKIRWKEKNNQPERKKKSKTKTCCCFFLVKIIRNILEWKRKDSGNKLFTAKLCKNYFKLLFCVIKSIICVCACARVSHKAEKQIKQIFFPW